MNEQPLLEAILEKVGPEKLKDCGIGCLANPKHEGFEPKVEWLQKRFAEGLRFLLFRDGKGKPPLRKREKRERSGWLPW